jgi:hypothetical protein
MIVVPDETPEIAPVTVKTVAIEVSPLLQVPPPASSKVPPEPTQTAVEPEMAAGKGFIVTISEVIHPVDNVNVITEVPGETPKTSPVGAIVATEVLTLLHVPLPPSLKLVVKPTHTAGVPKIADGNGLTVTVLPAVQPVPKV